MIIQKRKIAFFLPLILILFGVARTSAQEAADHLVITQVHLDSVQSVNSWIVVYNPTDNPLILERIRWSHIKTINMFPQAIQDQGGVQVQAGEAVVLCASDSLFKSLYGVRIRTISVPALSRSASGGFLFISTKGAREAKGNFVRYGEPQISSDMSNLAGNQVVGFSREGKSFARKITRTQTRIIVSDFVESPADPEKSNNQ
jgi:hypothetical protein